MNSGSFSSGTIAVANSAMTMTIDVKQAATFSSMFLRFNSKVSSEGLARAFGVGAVAHEGQHQLDYLNPSMGYPTNRQSENATEVSAYRTELGVAKGLGISTDPCAPGDLQKDINARVNEAANISTNAWCKENGC